MPHVPQRPEQSLRDFQVSVPERLPGDLLSRTAPFARLDDSTAIIGIKRDVTVPSGFSHGPLRPYLFNLDGSQEKLPALVHPNGPLDEIYWLIGSGLALAAFGTKGNYYEPEHEDSRPTLALVDARNGVHIMQLGWISIG